MYNFSKLALTSGFLLLTSSAIAVTPLHSAPDSSSPQSPQPLPSVRQHQPSQPQPSVVQNRSQQPAQNTRSLQFPTTPEEIRAALKLDKSDQQLKSKTRSLADLQNIKVGALVEFATDSTRVIPTVELDNFGKALATLEPGVRVEVGGHTDAIGNNEYNLNLSIRRAESVRQYLIQNYGVDYQSLTVRGYGEHLPIADNVTPQGKQLNRRVEFARILNY